MPRNAVGTASTHFATIQGKETMKANKFTRLFNDVQIVARLLKSHHRNVEDAVKQFEGIIKDLSDAETTLNAILADPKTEAEIAKVSADAVDAIKRARQALGDIS